MEHFAIFIVGFGIGVLFSIFPCWRYACKYDKKRKARKRKIKELQQEIFLLKLRLLSINRTWVINA